MRMLNLITIFASFAFAASRTSAPSGALVVGGSGPFRSITKAVAALSSTNTSEQVIFVNPGVYSEQVYIPNLIGPLTIYGYTSDDMSYSRNEVTITHSAALADSDNDDATATLRVWTSNFKLYNINVKNTYGIGSQALALSANAADQGYYGSGFYGYQDTVLAETGAQLYAKCYIEGATDFIFGQTADAWFESCSIGVLATSYGTITASGRSSNDGGYYVINNSDIAAASGQAVGDGAFYLGRPWGDYARVIVQNTEMSSVINAAGWHIWNTGDERTQFVTFEEYNNNGAGASGTRASFSEKISAAVSISTVLGSSYTSARYVDTSYLE